jgi:hypothetical protein
MKDRRSSLRQKSFLQGRIYFNNRRATLDCVIRDLSETGAKLKISEAVAVPEAMELYIPNREEIHRARVEWRSEDEIGVSFGEAAAPSAAPELPADVVQRLSKLESEVAALRRIVNELRSENRKAHGEVA